MLKISEINSIDLDSFYLKLSKNSITVKDQHNKTRNIINDIKSLAELQLRRHFDLHQKYHNIMEVRNAANNLYVDEDNNLYTFIPKDYPEMVNILNNSETERFYKKLDIFKQNNVNVIYAKIIS